MRILTRHWFRFLILAVSLSAAGERPLFAAAAAPAAKAKKGGGGGALARRQPGSEWWKEVDNGPFQADTILNQPNGDVVALKGLAIKLGAARDVSAVFDTELLCWRGGSEFREEGTASLARDACGPHTR